MTNDLRDEFAGRAMAALVTVASPIHPEDIAQLAYVIAAEMMKAREDSLQKIMQEAIDQNPNKGGRDAHQEDAPRP